MDTQTVPRRLQHHLQASERIWWVGKPDLLRSAWRRALRALAWGLILGLLVGEALAFWEILLAILSGRKDLAVDS